jgi:hypothetical protein
VDPVEADQCLLYGGLGLSGLAKLGQQEGASRRCDIESGIAAELLVFLCCGECGRLLSVPNEQCVAQFREVATLHPGARPGCGIVYLGVGE